MNQLWQIMTDRNSDLVDVVPVCTVECWQERGWVALGNPTDYFNASEQADLIASFT